jgi:RNA polymerase sigma-70 factor (sigma-E family)
MTRDEDFSAYVGARWPVLVRSAVFLGAGIAEAEDVVQTTLAKCYASWAKVEKADNRDAYVYRILLNCHRDSRRRRWWGERPAASVPDLPSADDTAEQVAIADSVHRALGDLSRDHREVVVLRFYAHLSEQQTADALGVAPGTVKSRLSRALARLATNPHLADLTEGTS